MSVKMGLIYETDFRRHVTDWGTDSEKFFGALNFQQQQISVRRDTEGIPKHSNCLKGIQSNCIGEMLKRRTAFAK
jgi:hypothetical protein